MKSSFASAIGSSRSIRTTRRHGQRWRWRSGTCSGVGDSGDDGERAAATALRLDPNLADSHAAMGAAHRSKGRFQEGLISCQNALRLEPNSYVGNRIAGLCCLGLRRYDDAIGHFELAAAAMETDFTAATFVSQCYKAKGDAERMRSARTACPRSHRKDRRADPGHSRAIGIGVACWQRWARRSGPKSGRHGRASSILTTSTSITTSRARCLAREKSI